MFQEREADMKIENVKINIEKNIVFHMIDCYEDSDLYEEITQEYEEILEEMKALCKPVLLWEKGEVEKDWETDKLPAGTSVLAVIVSIGEGISKYATQAFAQGDYVKGMLADAIADAALFSLEDEMAFYLKSFCEENQLGICRRLEAPHDIPISLQKNVWELTKAIEEAGIGISSGYMLDPVKSNAILYVLTEDTKKFHFAHDCRNCTNHHCKHRKVLPLPVKVREGEKEYELLVNEKETILDALRRQDASYSAVCGGTGKCGKCRIRVIEGKCAVSPSDKEHFTKGALEKGMRLACKVIPEEPMSVELCFQEEKKFTAVSGYKNISIGNKKDIAEELCERKAEENYGIAVDIGTTTIAIVLINLKTEDKVCTKTILNPQRRFGADVISRIRLAVEGKKEELQSILQKDIDHGIRECIEQSGIFSEKVTKVVIAGNTTMIHLLMGYDCKGLGEYPFTPVNTAWIEDEYAKILHSDLLNAKVQILPGISAFVGGDIVSGWYACDADEKKEYSLLIDLGTNGEVALGNSEKLLVTSTAAGPAFEGGNITWGVGSIEGAVAGVVLEKDNLQIRTIGEKEPIGICGTGVIEMTAELVRTGLVDETGCLAEEYFDTGFPFAHTVEGEMVFTQKDIREIQLAKAAIRAGIETLILRYGIQKTEISHVYLAGGFGFYLDWQKAIAIGMIPEEFAGKIEAVGNSSLGGAVKCLLSAESQKRLTKMKHMAEEINLSADKEFQELYMEHMYF